MHICTDCLFHGISEIQKNVESVLRMCIKFNAAPLIQHVLLTISFMRIIVCVCVCVSVCRKMSKMFCHIVLLSAVQLMVKKTILFLSNLASLSLVLMSAKCRNQPHQTLFLLLISIHSLWDFIKAHFPICKWTFRLHFYYYSAAQH